MVLTVAQNGTKQGNYPLTPNQEQLLYALLTSRTKAEAARKSGTPHRTMYNWFADPRFKSAYRAARLAVFDEAVAVLETNARKAAQVMADQLDPETWQGVKRSSALVKAAARLLDLAFKAHDSVTVLEELAELSAVIDAFKAGAGPWLS